MDGLVAEKLCNAVADSCNVLGAWHLLVANAPSSWVSSFWCARVPLGLPCWRQDLARHQLARRSESWMCLALKEAIRSRQIACDG